MAKIKELKHTNEDTGEVLHHQFLYWCEGCGYEHAFELRGPFGGHHYFNGDLNNPTVSPSLLENRDPQRVCHSFMNNGYIQYLGDCHHHLKNQTVELKDIDEMIEVRKKKKAA